MPIDPHAEILRLRTALRDLVALSTIPAAWVGREPPAIAAGLADVLVGSLHLDFAFVRLCDPNGSGAVEVTRGGAWKAFPEWLQRHLASVGQFSRREIIPDVGGGVEPCRGVVIPIAVNAEGGLVAVACDRTDFPTEIDQLLLSVAANHAATAFQSARLIHERRSAEEALRESEQRWRSLTEALPQLVWAATPDGACDYFSTQWTEYTGVPESDLLGWRWMDVLHPDDREPTRQFWTDSVAGRGPYDVEYRVRRRDGAYGWFKTRGLPIRGGEGNIIKWFGTCTDITDRKRIEEALRENEELFRGTFENAAVGMAHTALDGRFLGVNDKLCEIIGYSRQELLARRFQEITHPEDVATDEELARRIAAGELPTNSREKRYIRKDGSTVFVNLTVSVLRDSPRRPLHFISIVEDISARKRAEQALQQARNELEMKVAERTAELRRSESYLAEAQRLSHTGSFGWNVSSGEIYWSEETFRIAGFDPASKPTLELGLQRVHPEDIASVQQTLDRAAREGTNLDFEHRLLMPDGSVKYLQVVAHTLEKGESDSLEFAGVVMDITERMLASEALRKAQMDLAHVTRVMTMGELASSIAHEVNQPLAAVVTNSNACARWLAGEAPNLDEARECLRRIIRDGKRASEVIARIRSLVKKSAPANAPLDLSETIQEVLAITNPEARQHRVWVRTELATSLPPVRGDRVQLQQVVLNLVMNGIDAMKAVTDRPRELVIRCQPHESGKVLVAVQDSGIGLDPQSMHRLFEAFYTTKPEGMGIGLSISRSIIEAHGGRLWPVATGDCGATFQFTLPTDHETQQARPRHMPLSL